MALPATHNRTPNGESAEGASADLERVRGVYPRNGQPTWLDCEALWAGVGLGRQRISRIEEQVEWIMGDEILVSGFYGSFEQMVRRWHREEAAVNPAQRRRK